MSLGTDQGFLMSPELLGVAERAKHDPDSGGRHPGVLLRIRIRAWSSEGDVCPSGW